MGCHGPAAATLSAIPGVCLVERAGLELAAVAADDVGWVNMFLGARGSCKLPCFASASSYPPLSLSSQPSPPSPPILTFAAVNGKEIVCSELIIDLRSYNTPVT